MKENRLRSWLYKISARLEIEDYQDAETLDDIRELTTVIEIPDSEKFIIQDF